uniref:Uncharacterized protein n=1 Tax=Anguilla anguilla TaxID=7936 RepID=A0A0E9WFD7_ANGAN
MLTGDDQEDQEAEDKYLVSSSERSHHKTALRLQEDLKYNQKDTSSPDCSGTATYRTIWWYDSGSASILV